jgi:hypothetical protein
MSVHETVHEKHEGLSECATAPFARCDTNVIKKPTDFVFCPEDRDTVFSRNVVFPDLCNVKTQRVDGAVPRRFKYI